LGETSDSGSSVDPILFSNLASTDALVSVLDFSFQVDDDVFDLDTLLNTIAASRVGRTLEKAITNGTDFAGTALTNAPTGGLIAAAGNAGTVAAAGTVSYADAVKLYSAVDPAYRQNGYFYAHQSVNDYLAAQVDSTGRPLYKVSDAGNLLLVQGKELLINQALPALTSTAGVAQVAFGRADKALGYTLRDVRVQILQPNVEKLIRRVIFSVRFGAALLDSANAVKVLKS
jgi:HK97 family phage major capsid protein